MKLLLQLQRQTADNNPDVDIIRKDCERLLQKLLTALKEHIRHRLITDSCPERIEGNFELPRELSVTCGKIPRVPGNKQFYSYSRKNGQPMLQWDALCTAVAEGGLFSDKTVTVTLTPAGEQLLGDLMQAAESEGITLRFLPAVMTRTGRQILERFGTPVHIPNPITAGKGAPPICCVIAHYEIQ